MDSIFIVWLALSFTVGAAITFFIVNGKRHRERLEAAERLEQLKAASSARLSSEVEAVKKRVEKAAQGGANEKLEKLAEDLLPVVDAMHMAMGLKTDNVTSVKDGVGMIYERLETTLARHGCEAIYPERGDAFDPSVHQAVACHGEPNQVLVVKRIGFRVGNKVLRPAAVEVGTIDEGAELYDAKRREAEEVVYVPSKKK